MPRLVLILFQAKGRESFCNQPKIFFFEWFILYFDLSVLAKFQVNIFSRTN